MADDPTATFAAQAQAYVDFIENAYTLDLPDRLREARVQLLDLYKAALALPAMPEPVTVEAGPSPSTPKDWPGFGDRDHYWEVFDPYVNEPPVGPSLSDDLLDVYKDLLPGLVLRDAGHAVEALWEWRFRFDHHWGDHAIDALRALHYAITSART